MNNDLINLGLTPFFISQLSEDELANCHLARVTEVHRSGIVANNGTTDLSLVLGSSWYEQAPQSRPTVGDWVVLDKRSESVSRVLERMSLFKRIAAGNKVDVQLIAANINTLFIVTSCNEDFNESRLERYLSLAIEAGVDPVVVLSKIDLTDDTDSFVERVRSVSPSIPIEMVNALDSTTLSGLKAWITPQTTIALVGSSGVGKSSILNTLTGKSLMNTASIREDDAKGRHTTTYRALHPLKDGGILIDVPGMRELKVAGVNASLGSVFDDIERLALDCRFRNCEHEQEQGCAVLQALECGNLDKRRLQNYRKLLAEDARLSATLSEQRTRDRQFAKSVKTVVQQKRKSRSTF